MCTSTPDPLASMSRPKACEHKKYPVKLICSSSFQSASDSVSNLPGWSTPALLIRMSHLPKVASAQPAAAETLSASETSHSSAMPTPPCFLTSSAVCEQPLPSRSIATTLAPTVANWIAVSRPIPLPAPVMTHTRSCNPSQSRSFASTNFSPFYKSPPQDRTLECQCPKAQYDRSSGLSAISFSALF